jgi:hypothetical protein
MTNWNKSSRTALAQLSEKKPTTKSGQIRALFDDIEAVLAAGHSLQDVCASLTKSGLELTRQQLGSYLTRERRRRDKKQSSTLIAPRPTVSSATVATSTPTPVVPSDALSNLTARAKQTLEFNADADPSDLI